MAMNNHITLYIQVEYNIVFEYATECKLTAHTPLMRSVSICVSEQPRTFGNLANHSSPITEHLRSIANKTAY